MAPLSTQRGRLITDLLTEVLAMRPATIVAVIVVFVVGVLPRLVLGAPGSLDLSQAGKPSKEPLLSLSVDKTTFGIGEHIIVALSVKNLGPDMQIQRSFPDVDYEFLQIGPSNTVIPMNLDPKPDSGYGRAHIGAVVPGFQLKAGASWTDSFSLDDYYDFDTPGDYKVVATSPVKLQGETSIYTTLVSDPITFTLR